MSGTRLVADTNILIHLLKGRPDAIELLNGADVFISFITEMELLSKSNMTVDEETIILKLIKSCHIIHLDESIKHQAIRLRREHKFKLPDCIVMASAVYLGLPLATCDKQLAKASQVQLLILNS